MPKISIIVPVYNAEKYLSKCIKSLINQTLKDIEIILADDGSKDKSLEICNQFAQKDKRIKVFSQKNSGPSVARNNALKIATGEFIGFVDSDDYIKKDTYEKALNKMSKDVDLVIWAVNVVSDDKLSYTNWFQENYFKIHFKGKVKTTNDIRFKTDVVPWNKLYRASIIFDNNITFPAGRLYEDNAFWWKYTFFCKNIFFIDEKLHYYNMRQSSLRGEVIAKKQECEKDRIYMVENVFDFLQEHNLLNKENNELIEKLFLKSFIEAYDETSERMPIVFAAKELINKILLQRTQTSNKNTNTTSINLIKDEDTRKLAQSIIQKCEYIETTIKQYDEKHKLILHTGDILTEQEKQSVAKDIRERIDFVRNNAEKDTIFACEEIKIAADNLSILIEKELKKLKLDESFYFLKDYMKNLPESQSLEFDGPLIYDYILIFLQDLLKLDKAEELIKFSHFFKTIYPECMEFERMLGDAYMFLKNDEIKAMYYYLKYVDKIKDNASVYHVLADICNNQGDVFHQILFKQKEYQVIQNAN
ncbi:MAG: glycosyltransferase family 2 protein [Candidatus Gastranaerophilaceae bacterium]